MPSVPFASSLRFSWASILAGCGGSSGGKDAQTVTGPGFRFEAPAGWTVTRAPGPRGRGHGRVELVQVATFKLLRPYERRFSGRVRELDGG